MVGAYLSLCAPQARSLCARATTARLELSLARAPCRKPFPGLLALPLFIRHLGDSDRCHEDSADLVHGLSKRYESRFERPVHGWFRCVHDGTRILFEWQVDLVYVREQGPDEKAHEVPDVPAERDGGTAPLLFDEPKAVRLVMVRVMAWFWMLRMVMVEQACFGGSEGAEGD